MGLEKDEIEEVRDKARRSLEVSETLLVTALQAVINVLQVTTFTFRDVLESLYDRSALKTFEELLDKQDYSDALWRLALEHFIDRRVTEAYELIIKKGRFGTSKVKTGICLQFFFDHVLEELKREPPRQAEEEPKALVVQSEDATSDYEYKRIKRYVLDLLQENRALLLDDDAGDRELEQVAMIVCYDRVAEEYKELVVGDLLNARSWDSDDLFASAAQGNGPGPDQHELVQERLLAAALGASVALSTVIKDFLSGVGVFSTKNLQVFGPDHVKTIRALYMPSDSAAVERTFLYMADRYFQHILECRASDKKKKVSVKPALRRRVSGRAVDGLVAKGLTKIQKNKLFRPDPVRAGMMEFKAPDANSLAELMNVLQVRKEVQNGLIGLWKRAEFKSLYFVIINTVLISRTNTDLKRALSEILYKFGISL
jgi:hypothetical protein